MKNHAIITLIAVIAAGFLFSTAGYTAQVSIFELPSGTKSAGLGGAVTALADDPEAWSINPAATARLRGWDGSFQNIFWMYDMNRFDLTAGKSFNFAPFRGLFSGFLTGSFRLFYPGKFINYDEWGYEKSEAHAWDSLMSVGYAVHSLESAPFLDMGLTLKWLHRTYDPGQDNGVALDVGFMGRFKIKAFRDANKPIMKNNLHVGISFRNLLGNVGEDTMPLEIRFGAQYRPIAPLMVIVDYGLVLKSRDTFKMAFEYNFIGQFFGRFGYSYSESGLSITPGLGFQFLAGRFKYEVEYAFLPLAIDRNVHSIGFRMSLPDLSEKEAVPEYLKLQKDEDRKKESEKQLLEERLKFKEMEIELLKDGKQNNPNESQTNK